MKPNLSKIMKRAHALARTFEGDYQARLSLGLSQSWFEYHEVIFESRKMASNTNRSLSNIELLLSLCDDDYYTKRNNTSNTSAIGFTKSLLNGMQRKKQRAINSRRSIHNNSYARL